jgi:hypothetical protein
MSATPKVDKWAFDVMPGGPEVVSANCARELEELLMAAEDENEVLHKEIERLDEMVMRWFRVGAHSMNGRTVALVRQAIFHVLDEGNPRMRVSSVGGYAKSGLEWDFDNDEERVDFADQVVAWLVSRLAECEEGR